MHHPARDVVMPEINAAFRTRAGELHREKAAFDPVKTVVGLVFAGRATRVRIAGRADAELAHAALKWNCQRPRPCGQERPQH